MKVVATVAVKLYTAHRVYMDASQLSKYVTTAIQWANVEGQITSQTNSTVASQSTVIHAKITTILMCFTGYCIKSISKARGASRNDLGAPLLFIS